MPSFQLPFSKYYDLFYAEKNYEQEVSFILSKLKPLEKNAHIVEMACGTGNHAFEFEKKGYHNIRAFDLSTSQIEKAILKQNIQNSSIQFEVGDMCSFTIGHQNTDLVLCLFDSIGFVLTNERIQEVFKNVHRALMVGGSFVFEFWHTAAMVKNYDPKRVKTFNINDTKITRTSTTILDIEKQTADVKYTLDINENGTTKEFTEIQKNRYFSIQEMKYFLEVNGFKLVSLYDGFTENQQITDNSWHIVVFAEKL